MGEGRIRADGRTSSSFKLRPLCPTALLTLSPRRRGPPSTWRRRWAIVDCAGSSEDGAAGELRSRWLGRSSSSPLQSVPAAILLSPAARKRCRVRGRGLPGVTVEQAGLGPGPNPGPMHHSHRQQMQEGNRPDLPPKPNEL